MGCIIRKDKNKLLYAKITTNNHFYTIMYIAAICCSGTYNIKVLHKPNISHYLRNFPSTPIHIFRNMFHIKIHPPYTTQYTQIEIYLPELRKSLKIYPIYRIPHLLNCINICNLFTLFPVKYIHQQCSRYSRSKKDCNS